MIAKALAHEPEILFLDEPTAGVDVELRRDMWALVRRLRANGTTIILTTHYIDEAEEMADRIGVIAKGELILAEEKAVLKQKLGKRQLPLNLHEPLQAVPRELEAWNLALNASGSELQFNFEAAAAQDGRSDISSLLRRLGDLGIAFKDLNTRQSSLEEIFVNLLKDRDAAEGRKAS